MNCSACPRDLRKGHYPLKYKATMIVGITEYQIHSVESWKPFCWKLLSVTVPLRSITVRYSLLQSD